MIVVEDASRIAEYESVSIGFEVSCRLRLDDLFNTTPVEPWWKDYDDCAPDRPTNLFQTFDTTHWGILAAFDNDVRLGGAIIAARTPEYALLGNRDDLAALIDIRVAPEARGQGVGRALFEAVVAWVRTQGYKELWVETQDTNVPACRFYKAMGLSLHSIDEGAYGPEIDEARLIWSLRI